jgi:hypothetical protein
MQTAGRSERRPEAACPTSLDEFLQSPYAGLRFCSAQANASEAASNFLTGRTTVEFFHFTEICKAEAKWAKQCVSTVRSEWEQPREAVEGILDGSRNNMLRSASRVDILSQE